MYKIAVCDNQESCLDAVKETIEKYQKKHQIDVEIRYFNDSDELMDLIEGKKLYDAYFLDVDMPCYSGMDLVKKIREITELPIIVLLTGYERYAIQACGMNIFRYVLKSKWEVEGEQLLNDVFCCLAQRNDKKTYVIQNNRKYVKFLHRDLLYIEKNEKNAVFTLTEGRKETERLSLHKVYNKLNDSCMYFHDKGTIINVQHISRIEDDKIDMDDGKGFYGGVESIRKIKQYLCTYWGDFS